MLILETLQYDKMSDEVIVQKRIYELVEYIQLLIGENGYIDPATVWLVCDSLGWEEAQKISLIQFIAAISSTSGSYYLNDGVPYTNEADVLANYPFSERTQFATVNIAGTEWQFQADKQTLVVKFGAVTLLDGAVTLTKMANMPTSTLLYNILGVSSPPQYVTLAQLKIDLGIPTNQTKQTLFTITLPNGNSIAERIAGAVIKGDGTSDWTLEAFGDTGIDLKVIHTTGRKLAGINILSIDGLNERPLKNFSSAYSDFYSTSNEIIIESLATIKRSIVIHFFIS